MTRAEFEQMDSGSQKRYAKEQYPKVCKQITEELHDNGEYKCKICHVNNFSHFHHIWFRSHCGTWWTFQRENLIPVCFNCHPYKIHDAPHRLEPGQKQMLEALRKEIISKDIQEKLELGIK